ncbi:MAG: Cation transport ATPase [Verrucomicrobiota bacterium]
MQTNSARTDLRIEGLNCGNCVRHATEALQGVPGVTAAEVSLETGLARVRWQDAPDVPALQAAIRAAGFRAVVPSPTEPPPRPARPWGSPLLAGGLPTALLLLGEWGLGLSDQPAFRWASLGLATVVMALPGRQFLTGAWRQFKAGTASMDTLVALGSSTAFSYSAAILLTGGAGHLYFVEAAAIVTLISLGHWLEARVSARASNALRALMQLAPGQARCLGPDGAWASVPVTALQPGDRIELRPGERVPADARVLEGASAVDETMLTGESLPVEKAPGSDLFAGTLNQNGRLLAQVTGTGDRTALARIIDAVQRAQTSRAHIQRLGDQVSRVFVPTVILVAFAAGLAWGLAPETARHWHAALAPAGWHFAPPPGTLAGAIHVVASVLIIACPCAMGLATPAAIMAAANAAARRGILIRDGVALEKAGTLTTVLFDKTGTLTAGHPEVVFSEFAHPEGRSLAAQLARASTHPLSRAAAAHLDPPHANPPHHAPPAAGSEIREVRGRGIESRQNGQDGRLGSLGWLQESGVDTRPATTFVQRATAEAASVIGVAQGSHLVGLLAIRDTLKPGAAAVIQHLRRQGLQVGLVTGDHAAVAAAIGAQLGLAANEVHAEVRPEAKADLVRRLQAAGQRVAFAGDGLNDGPALEQADLGIAVCRASDVAREAADLVLLRTEIDAIPEALGLARATLRVIRQNLFWAFFYNAIGVPLAALGFMSPILCAAAMGASDLIVIGNALRLGRWKLPAPAGR